MTASDRPHWLDLVSDLLTHLEMADAQRSAEGTALARILSIAIMQILVAQSDGALAAAQAIAARDRQGDVAEALNLEIQRRRLTPPEAAPARTIGKAMGT